MATAAQQGIVSTAHRRQDTVQRGREDQIELPVSEIAEIMWALGHVGYLDN